MEPWIRGENERFAGIVLASDGRVPRELVGRGRAEHPYFQEAAWAQRETLSVKRVSNERAPSLWKLRWKVREECSDLAVSQGILQYLAVAHYHAPERRNLFRCDKVVFLMLGRDEALGQCTRVKLTCSRGS